MAKGGQTNLILRRGKPKLSVDKHDPRTLLVIDRLEAVASRIEDLALEMENTLKARGEGDDGAGSGRTESDHPGG